MHYNIPFLYDDPHLILIMFDSGKALNLKRYKKNNANSRGIATWSMQYFPQMRRLASSFHASHRNVRSGLGREHKFNLFKFSFEETIDRTFKVSRFVINVTSRCQDDAVWVLLRMDIPFSIRKSVFDSSWNPCPFAKPCNQIQERQSRLYIRQM